MGTTSSYGPFRTERGWFPPPLSEPDGIGTPQLRQATARSVLYHRERTLWFDAWVDAESQRIRELERGFRRDGLPNLIVDLSAAEDIFTRASPFLALVFVVEIVNALDIEASWTTNLLLALGGATLLLGAFGVVNVVRGRPFLSIPRRVGTPELAAFVVLPALLPVVFSGQLLFGFNTILVNAAIVVLAYLVVGFGIFSIVRGPAFDSSHSSARR